MGPGPYNCQEAVAFRGCELPIETLLCCVAWGLMNASLRGEKSKTMQFSLSNLCQSWLLPQTKQALLWAFGLARPCPPPALPPNPSLTFDSFCQDRGNMPTGKFFFFFPPPPSDDFPFNCQDALWSNCSHTPSNTQSGNASCTPSHLLQSTLSAAQHTRDGGKE